jgi:RNA polymerase sigma factor (sigma-70 family)
MVAVTEKKTYEQRGFLSNEAEYALLAAYQRDGDPAALRALLANKRHLWQEVHRRSRTDDQREENYQLAVIGLMRAAKKFDPAEGVRFGTYLNYWVKNEITRHKIDQGYAIRVPVHHHKTANHFFRERRKLALQGVHGREAEEVIREGLGMSHADFESIVNPIFRNFSSLDKVVYENDREGGMDTKLSDVIPSGEELVEEQYSREERVAYLQRKVREVLRTIHLTERERRILEHRLMVDFYDEGAERLLDVGNRFGVSREMIRQNEAALIRKLRAKFEEDRAFMSVVRNEFRVVDVKAKGAEAMMASKQQEKRRYKAIVVHGKPDHYEQNGIARKLFERGIDVARAYFITFPNNAKRQDWRGADFIILITSSVDRAVAKAVRDEAKVREVRFFEVSHRVSEWQSLEIHVGYSPSPVVEVVVEETNVVELQPPKLREVLVLPALPPPTPSPPPVQSVADRIAGELRDNEELARIWEREAGQARADLANVLKENEQLRLDCEALRKTSGVVVREQLAADVARKEEERRAAVREKEDVLVRLEAAETLRKHSRKEHEELQVQSRKLGEVIREQEGELLVAKARIRELESNHHALAPLVAGESAVLKKVTAIVAACAAGVVDNDEAVAKIAKAMGIH